MPNQIAQGQVILQLLRIALAGVRADPLVRGYSATYVVAAGTEGRGGTPASPGVNWGRSQAKTQGDRGAFLIKPRSFIHFLIRQVIGYGFVLRYNRFVYRYKKKSIKR